MSDALQISHHVDAVFGGERVHFALGRDRRSIEALELAVGSVSVAWARFRSGDWTMRDVRSILVQAFPRPDQLPADALSCFLPRPAGNTSLRLENVDDRVDAVIAARPLATYAPLAGAVLTAAFIGLPAAAAAFHEDVPLVAAEPVSA